jgi:hypothetical protein
VAITPDERDRIVCFWVNDGKHKSGISCVKVNVTVVNNHPPTLTADPSGQVFKEGSLNGVQVLAEINIDDPDHPDIFLMHGATVTVDGGNMYDEVYVNVEGTDIRIEGGNGWDQTVVLTGEAHISEYKKVLSTAKYRSIADEPDPGPRILNFTIYDGIHSGSVTVMVIVENINDNPPEVDPGITTESFVEDLDVREEVPVAPHLLLDDPDKNGDYIDNVTVIICQADICGQERNSPDIQFEELDFDAAGSCELMVMFYYDENGKEDKTKMKLAGREPKEKYQTCLQEITYFNNKTSISCPAWRYFLITANDGRNEGDNIALINIQFDNKYPPTIDASMRTSEFTEGGPAVSFGQTIGIFDKDERCNTSTIKSAKFKLHALDGIDNEILSINETLADMYGIANTLTDDGYGYVELVLMGIANIRQYQEVLKSVTYVNLADEPTPGQRNIEAYVNDGEFESNRLWFNITIISVNDKPPVLELSETNYTFTENGPAVRFGVEELSDADSKACDKKVLELSVTVTPRPDGNRESVSYNGSLLDNKLTVELIEGGFVVKAGDQADGADLELYKLFLDGVTYDNEADEPYPHAEPKLGIRHVTFKFKTNIVSTIDSDQITEYSVYLNVVGENDNVPNVDLNGVAPGHSFTTDFTEEGMAVAISSGLLITDIDKKPDTPLDYAEIKVINATTYDMIRVFTYNSSVTVSGNGTGWVKISGNASRQEYAHILGSATYQNTADEPTKLVVDIQFQVRDKDGLKSPVVSTVVTVIEVCDPIQFEPRNMSLYYKADFSEEVQDPIKVVADDFVLDDDDADKVVGGTITIVNVTYGERLRVLDSSNMEVTDHGGVTISFSEGVLTFVGEASLETYRQLIKWVKYDNTNPCPVSLYRHLHFNFTDDCGSQNEPETMTVITILPFNNPPSLDLDSASMDDPVIVPFIFYGINNRDPTPQPVFPKAALTDCDTPDVLGYLKVTIQEASNVDSERMIFHLNGTNLQVVADADSTEFTITYTIQPVISPTTSGSGSGDNQVSPQVFQDVLKSMEYINTATKPFETARKVTVTASDGRSGNVSTAMAEIHLERIPLNPLLKLNQTEFDYSVDLGNPLAFLKGISLTPGDSFFIHQVEITILNPAPGNVDKLVAPNDLPRLWGSIGSGTPSLVIGTSVAISFAGAPDVQNVLQLVEFESTDEQRNPPRNISVVALDSPTRRAGNTVYVNIDVAPANEPPMVDVTGAESTFEENGTSVTLYNTVTITDGDDMTLQNVTLTLERGQSVTCPGAYAPTLAPNFETSKTDGCLTETENNIKAECIEFTSSNKGTFIIRHRYTATHLMITIESSDSNLRPISEYETLLMSAKYRNYAIGPSNADRIVTLTVNDGKIVSDPATVTVKVSPKNNNPPNLNISTISVNFEEGSEPVHLISSSDSVSILDPDCQPKVTKAVVSLKAGGSQQWLAVSGSLPYGINASSDGQVLTITGEGNHGTYSTILRSVVYGNNESEPASGQKNVVFRVFDGQNWSNEDVIIIIITNINDNPPSVDLDSTMDGTGYSTTYMEEAPPVDITSDSVQVEDPDPEARIHSVTVYLEMAHDGNSEVISSNKNYTRTRTSNTFEFIFVQPKTLSEAEVFLESLQYRNNHLEPTPGDRYAKIKLNDGTHDSNETVCRIHVATKNDRPPVFSQNYTRNVTENSPEDTFVVMVKAVDLDSHITVITYSISGDLKGHFKINSTTGTITTTDVPLDREMNTDHTLTVVASDGMFNVSVNVHIIVLDEDDNCPTIDNELYQKAVSSSAAIGSEVVSLKVTDPDKVTVFNATISDGNDNGLFDINGTNVYVAKSLSSFEFTGHTLSVAVALPGCSDSSTIKVFIFSSDAEDQFEVYENISIGAKVGKIIQDENFPDANYTIHPPDAPFRIDQKSVITTTQKLNRETDANFTLIVEFIVSDVAVNLTVEVHVLDVNDNAPVFVNSPYSDSVMESAGDGQSVAQVTTTDEDIGDNAKVTFSLEGTAAFKINSDGTIAVNGSIDYEVQCEYKFEVQAVDEGHPPKTSSAQVTVEVLNVNEFAPVFQFNNYSAEVVESLPDGSSVSQVSAVDNDGCPGLPPPAITYSFVGQHAGFAINATDGLITVDGSLTPGFHSLNVSASDGERQDTVSVEVNVTVATSPVVDLNGNMPGINNHLTMTSGIPKVNLASSGTVTLPQNGIIESMTITITNPVDDDSERLEADLETADSTNIEVQYDSDTHQLTLNGSASASAYQAALRTVRYVNDRMEDVLSMSLMSVKRNRVITVSASTLDATSEVASATVSFNRNCGSSVTASSNAELEQMAVCVEISGSATINCPTSSCDIEDLVILSDLMKVTGKLTIERTKVKNLAGLENLQTYGSLRITLNTELESISELREKYADLLEVSDIEVQECGLLQDISGLRGIENVTGDLVIEGNAVTSLTGLDNLTYVKGDFKLSDNHMKTLDGLGMLQSVGGSLTISDNKKLTSLNGLSSLTSIGGLFTVSTNEELVCLSTLQCADKQPVTDVGDSMLFMLNPKACFEESFWKALANSGSQVLLLMNGDTENCNCDC